MPKVVSFPSITRLCRGNAGVIRTAKRRRSLRRPACGVTAVALEQLEPRIALTVSPFEQEFIYLLNRARHNPSAYQAERGLSVSLGAVTPRQPLAVNALLTAAAGFKSDDMATRNYFSNTSGTGETPNQLVRRFGYDLPSTVFADGFNWVLDAVGNNVQTISGGRSTPAATLQGLIESKARDSLLGETAHRQVAREVGVGYAFRDPSTYKHYWTVIVTPPKASTSFLTGVAFADHNVNSRFEANEGLGSVVITAVGPRGRFTTTTLAAGGWAMAVPQGDYVVTASGGAFFGSSSASVKLGDKNLAVDFVSGTPKAWVNFTPPPATAPVAPTNLVATAGSVQASLRWTAPSFTGGASITNYVIQFSSNNGRSWTTVNRAASAATTATVTGLVSGTGYIFRVAAVNSVGTGRLSLHSNSVRPLAATAPSPPTNLAATVGTAQASLRWTAPTSNGGAAITNYAIQFSSNNGGSWTTVSRAASTATTATVTGLVSGTPYIFRVAAVNTVGASGFTITVPDYPVKRTDPGLSLEKMVDMANTGVARKIQDKLRSLAQGNEKSAEVTKITVDRATGDVTGGFKVRHRQVWKFWNPIKGETQKQVVYDLTQSGNFTFNIFSLQISGSLDLGRGVKVKLQDLKKLSEGDFTPLWTAAVTLRQRSNYDGRVADIRARNGAANVYVAPKSFVDWMGPSTLVRWGVEAVLSGGGSLSTIPAEVANKLRAEALGITNWMTARVKDPATAKAIAEKIVGALANRGNIEDPRFAIRWSKVDYWYESNVLPGIRSQRIEHGMYSIVLKT
jgi:hypothetical protein